MILPLIVHDHELWHRSAPPIAQPAPAPMQSAAAAATFGAADIAARRALCTACEHLTTPAQCGCFGGLCRHPDATHPNITAIASAECPLGRWPAIPA